MKKFLKVLLRIVIAIAVTFVILFVVLTIAEFRPKDREEAYATSGAVKTLTTEDEVKILTWNVGYGALGDNADFFMDGGKSVYTAGKSRVSENLHNVLTGIQENNPDITLLQEVDKNSMRSFGAEETQYFADNLKNTDTSFGYNYRCLFVPYPMPPIGLVNSGIFALSKYGIAESERVSLPCPFKWPVSVGNLKRCAVINRIPIEDSDSELVVINLHLEAYDSGEGKIAQTKMLKELLDAETEAGNYVIAGGDFNQTFSNVDISAYPTYEGMWTPGIIDEDDFSGYNLVMDADTPSCRSLDKPYADADKDNFQYYVIDGFVVSDNIEVTSAETLDYDFVGTDHNPVVMTFKFK